MSVDYKEQAGIAMNPHSQLADAAMDPQVTLGALAFADELGRLLWRMKYGQDVKHAGMKRATLILASRVRASGKFKRSKFTGVTKADRRDARMGFDVERSSVDIVERFAARVITEWVADLCVTCHGRRWIPRMSKSKAAAAPLLQCPGCGGTGRAPQDDAARARCMGLDLEVYRKHWSRLFAAMLALLDEVDAATEATVKKQMRWR
ncbi:hypothetical protein PPN31114_03523 [Pandoraea pneumonica]|uniref:Uncharacterized protein n=1 Tax=Pandoraea pneumonica TaxID=2508299 RepID=A0A5E4WV58_9BURK|nr:hypothetical protein [Pandoraea pneumonica]VVE28401.1 hypothetical protein PPN31114_03523 [Pandoraea pneumonica]